MSFSYPPFSGFRITTDPNNPGQQFGWHCDSCGYDALIGAGDISGLWNGYEQHLINSHALTPPIAPCPALQSIIPEGGGNRIGTLICTLDNGHTGEHAWEYKAGA